VSKLAHDFDHLIALIVTCRLISGRKLQFQKHLVGKLTQGDVECVANKIVNAFIQ